MTLFLFFLNLFVFSTDTIDIQKVTELTLSNNFDIIIVRNQSDISENNNSILNNNILPTINGNFAYNNSTIDGKTVIPGNPDNTIFQRGSNLRSINAGATLNWTLFDGFSMFYRYKINQIDYDKSKIQTQIAIENNLKNVYQLFLDLVYKSNLINNLSENLKLSKDRRDYVLNQFDFGKKNSLDVSFARVDFNNDSIAYLNQIVDYQNTAIQLNYLIGSEIKKEYYYDAKLNLNKLDTYENLKSKVLSKNSQINLSIKNQEISNEEINIIYAQYMPEINFLADYSYSSRENSQGFPKLSESYGPSFGLNARINIFNGLKTNLQAQNAKINNEILRMRINQISNQIEMNLYNLYNSYEKLLIIYDLEKENLLVNEDAYTRAQDLFNYSKINSLEFRNAQLNLLNSKNKVFKILKDLELIQLQINLLAGIFPN